MFENNNSVFSRLKLTLIFSKTLGILYVKDILIKLLKKF